MPKTSLRDYDIIMMRCRHLIVSVGPTLKTTSKWETGWVSLWVKHMMTIIMYHVKGSLTPRRDHYIGKNSPILIQGPSKPVKLRNVIRFSDTEPIRFSWGRGNYRRDSGGDIYAQGDNQKLSSYGITPIPPPILKEIRNLC